MTAPALSPSGILPIATARQSWRHIGVLLRGHRLRLTATIALLLIGCASALVIPLMLGRIVDAVLAGAAAGTLIGIAGVIVGAGLFSALLLRWGGGLLVRTLQGALAQLREEVLEHALTLEQGTVENAGMSDTVSRVTGDVESITEAVSDTLPRFVQALFTIALTLVGLTALDPFLAAAALVAVPVQLISTLRFLRTSRPLYRRLRQEEAARGQALIETVRGADTVVAHRMQPERLDLVERLSLTAVATQRETVKARNRFNAGLNLAEFLGLSAVLAVGFWRAVDADLSVGAVTAAALLFHRLFDPIGALLSSLDDLQRAGAGIGRLVGVLTVPRSVTTLVETRDAGIRVTGVGYRYGTESRWALSSVDLAIASGSTVVLVGSSGSGKSTLAQLIAGSLQPEHGTVQVGGVAADRAGCGGSRAVLLVTQETHLFAGTLADNLRLGSPDASDEQLRTALAAVGADWADELGLHTPLGGGTDQGLGGDASGSMSEDRAQVIALARVILAAPAVVVLDEATAQAGSSGALDQAVTAAIAGRTAVIVAHRFGQAASADSIVVLERGHIVEQGSHRELITRPGGAYASLHAAASSEHL